MDRIIRMHLSHCLPVTYHPFLESATTTDPKLETTTPVKREVRRESSESLSGLSPIDGTTIMCRNMPPALNKKDVIEKHFSRFGRVRKVLCRPLKNLAIVHFDDHVSKRCAF